MLSPVWFPVPPERYGGIESVVSLLTEGLVARGADVTLFASGDSITNAPLVHVFDEAPTERIGETFWELNHALACLTRLDDFDLVHDHTGLLGLTLFGLASTPLVHTVHGPLEKVPAEMYLAACGVGHDVGLVSLTHAQRRPLPGLPWLANIENAIDSERYPFAPEPGDGLLFLGRMSPEKGAHRAIEVAKRTGRPLRIAAKCREPGELAYFDAEIRPHLDDRIEYVGEVGHEDKCRLLAEAHALLVPIDWEEPFGLVMIEAMACGTPVVALRRGSVPEVLDHGRTGLVVDSLAAMASAVDEVSCLDPLVLRSEAEVRFSPERMIDDHLEAYERLLDGVEERSSRLATVG
ncbi:MAG: glycosyltransferase family 4 protein [Actinobacteria bacterium]|nr:glycosyltransferase family 4 protein [Actinomycetota bacterium]